MRAYVEIDIESGRDVIASAEYIRQIEGVTEAYAVSDMCDVFAAVEADDFRGIFEFVMRKIQVIRGVTDTRIASREQQRRVVDMPRDLRKVDLRSVDDRGYGPDAQQ